MDRESAPPPIVKGYYLRELLGIGGFGRVFKAHQPTLERDVAMKIILPKHSNDPEFIRRFSAEAQIVARLEHLHIVPIYDYWRNPFGAYIVMRYLRGGSLRKWIYDYQNLSLLKIGRMLSQVGSALATAHNQNVIHQDVKPENILLDEVGNAFLVDFGIAKTPFGPKSDYEELTFGSPEYVSPEAILHNETVPQSDIYSLGIVLFELLTGHLPFESQNQDDLIEMHVSEPIPPLERYRSDLPRALSGVLWRATAKSPTARYASMLELVENFWQAANLDISNLFADDAMSHNGRAITEERSDPENKFQTLIFSKQGQIRNPFKGLRSFEEADASNFFGREKLVDELLDKLKNEKRRFLALVGPSGSGKSSVIHAGLLPALRLGYIEDSSSWFMLTITPGSQPLNQLKQALLGVATDVTHVVLDSASPRHDDLLISINHLLKDDSQEIFLAIDQFEEIFTQLTDDRERQYFLANLEHAITYGRLRVVITLRADYYDRPLLDKHFGELMRRNTIPIVPLNNEEIQDVIVKPAKNIGLVFEDGLIASIAVDVAKQPGALPLLQYTLSELFDKKEDNKLTLDAYEQIGRIGGALGRRSEDCYSGLTAEEQAMTRIIFLRLITLREDRNPARHRVPLATLKTNLAHSAMIDNILNAFGEYRLLTFDHEAETREPTVEIAHEALIQGWTRLKEWTEASRDFLRLQQRLETAAFEWAEANQDDSFLARGSLLSQFEEFRVAEHSALSDNEQLFLDTSLKARARQNRIRQLVAFALVALSIMAIVVAIFANNQRGQAVEQRDRANLQNRVSRSRELAISSLINQSRIGVALLLGLEAENSSNSFEAQNSLISALQIEPFLETIRYGHGDSIRAIALSPDGNLLATGGRDNRVLIWDMADNTSPLYRLSGHNDWVNAVAFSPDSKILASAGNDGTLFLWDAATGGIIGQPIRTEGGTIWSLAFTPDGQEIISGSEDGLVRFWNVETRALNRLAIEAHTDSIYSIVIAPDGQTFATGSADQTIRIWDLASGEPIGDALEGHQNWVLSLAYSPDGDLLASTGADATLVVWDIELAEPIISVATGHEDWVWQVVFNAAGDILTTASADGTIKFWDPFTGELVRPDVHSDQDSFRTLVAYPEGNRLVTHSGADVWILNMDQGPLIEQRLMGHRSDVLALAESPTLNLLASAGGFANSTTSDNRILLWDLTVGSLVGELDGAEGPITDLAVSPDGKYIISTSADQTIRVWDLATQTLVGTPIEAHEAVVWTVAIHPDGLHFYTGGDTGRLLAFNFISQQLEREFDNDGDVPIYSLAISPDGQMLASGGRDGSIHLWNTETGDLIAVSPDPHLNIVTDLAFNEDGTLLASSGRDSKVKLWDIENDIVRTLEAHQNWVMSVRFVPNTSLLVSGSRDETIIFWDIESARIFGQPFIIHDGWVNALAIVGNGTALASAGTDHTIYLTTLDHAEWHAAACAIANRNLNPEEWQSFLPDLAYRETCDLN